MLYALIALCTGGRHRTCMVVPPKNEAVSSPNPRTSPPPIINPDCRRSREQLLATWATVTDAWLGAEGWFSAYCGSDHADILPFSISIPEWCYLTYETASKNTAA